MRLIGVPKGSIFISLFTFVLHETKGQDMDTVISAMDASIAVPTAALAGIVVSGARAVLASDVGWIFKSSQLT